MKAPALPRERPLLYSAPMVRAILAGAKTQTRRVVRAPIDFVGPGGCNGPNRDDPSCWGWEDGDGEWWKLRPDPWEHQIACPFGVVGDRLWVRESFCVDWSPTMGGRLGRVIYKADDPTGRAAREAGYPREPRWRPSIHMPRWACRIVLEITGVRVERVQAISDADIVAEGVAEYARSKGLDPARLNLRAAWIDLWDATNNPAHSWHRNPWTWVVEFRRVEGGGS